MEPATDTTRFELGSGVECLDGHCGQVRRLLVEPVSRVLTHLAVEAEHRVGLGRLVPVDAVETAWPVVRLTLSLAEFEVLEQADVITLPLGPGGDAGREDRRMLSTPTGDLDDGDVGELDEWGANASQPVEADLAPPGTVSLTADDPVHATDGDAGRVEGVMTEGPDHRISHILVVEGHLVRSEVPFPISEVAEIGTDGVQLNVPRKAKRL